MEVNISDFRLRTSLILRSYQLDIHKTSNFKGYTAFLGENTDPTGLGDMHEAFDIGCETPSEEENNGQMTGGNVWPPEIPEFKEIVTDY